MSADAAPSGGVVRGDVGRFAPPVLAPSDVVDHPHAVLADVRWYLDGRSGREAYEQGHLPGAVFVDVDRNLSTPATTPFAGRHPFPTPERFAEAMSRAGIGDSSEVIAYDDTGGMTAGRLVVMLRLLGRPAMLLNGGLRHWPGSLTQGRGADREPLVFTPRPWPPERLADADTTAALAQSEHALLDARSAERFAGVPGPLDPRPGHVPGARSAPWTSVLDPETGLFRSPEQLRRHFHALGSTGTGDDVAYCGSGVSACMNILAMEHAGLTPARLYVASFSGWAADPDRPVEAGV